MIELCASCRAHQTIMRYDSSPPVFYDDLAVRYDEPDALSPQPKVRMQYVALKLGQKSLDQKLDFTTTLAGNLTTYIADKLD